MAAKKNPKADEAYKLYKDGMKLLEIADRFGVPDGTVRRWKSRYSWDVKRSEKKRMIVLVYFFGYNVKKSL